MNLPDVKEFLKTYLAKRVPFSQAQGQQFKQTLTPVAQKINASIPGGYKAGVQRVKTAVKTNPLQFTPLSMRSNVVPAVKTFAQQIGVKPQRAEDVAYGMRGALGITPFRTFNDAYEPTTQRQQTAQKIGQSAYGAALTAPLGGPNYLMNTLTRGAQGAAWGTGIGIVSNVLTSKPVTQDLGKHTLQGVENSYQLAFSNLFADKIAAKWLPSLTSKKTGTVFNLLKEASKNDSASRLKRQLLLNGAKTLFYRALLETPIENTFFTAIDRLGANDKSGFLVQWMKNLPGNLLGNLLYAGADVGFRGTWNFNKKQIDEAGQALIKTLKDQRGFAKIPDIKLSPDRGMGLDLRRMGYTSEEIKKMTPTDAQEIMTAGKTSASWLEEPGWLRKKQQPPAKPDLAAKEMDRIVNDIPVEKKVNFLSYLSTPEKVFKKLGMEIDFKQIRKGHESYQTHLKQEVKRVSDWIGRVPSKESNVKIFQWLDGKKDVELNKTELKVAKEIKPYLKDWAAKLELPEDKRISNYITHIFEKGVIEKEFDPEIVRQIVEEIPGSVYDPFLMRRKGENIEYVEDTWRALSAYVKRGTRKFNMDPALSDLKRSAEKLDLESWNYVKKFADRVNLRPTELDTLVDNFIKQTPVRYKLGQRPVALGSRQFRQMVYRATLGLNARSALTNLSQGANTYAVLKEKYTAKGYLELFKRLKNKDLDELYQTHILEDSFIQDKTLNVKKKMIDGLDKSLFAMFEFAEKVNRGSAYFGAKQKALDEGKSTQEAVEFAKKVVRDTQFKFGAIDTPVALNSDVIKLLTQYSSYGIKQVEFLGEMVKSKDLAGMIRYAAATFLFSKTVGKLYGYKWTDAIPGFSASPFLQVAGEAKKLASLDEDTRKEGAENLKRQLPGLVIPAGTQIKKTIQGLGDVGKGYSETATGRVRYPVEQSPAKYLQAGVFGKWALPEAREYFNQDRKVLGEKQSETFKSLGLNDKFKFYNQLMTKREKDRQEKAIKDDLEKSQTPSKVINDKFYYLDEDGGAKDIDLTWQPTAPKLTKNEVLDKKLISAYKSEITAKEKDILELYGQGYLSAPEAEKELQALLDLRESLKTSKAKTKSKAKITVAKVTGKVMSSKVSFKKPSLKPVKLKGFKSKTGKIKAKQIYKF